MPANLYKALYISDIHMSNRLPGAKLTADGRTDRLDDQVKLWEHVAETAQAEDVDDIVEVGDLFDKALVDPVTLTTTAECLVKLPVPVRLLPGNHDAASIRGGRFAVEAFGAMQKEGLHFMRTGEPYCPRDWLTLHPLAFMPVGDTRAALAEIRASLDTSVTNVLLFHNSILGASHLGWKCDDGLSAEEVCEDFNQVVAGHFHEHQTFGPGGIGMYLSAPMHHSYSDVGRTAGYWVITYKRGRGVTDMRYIDPGLPKFHLATVKDGAIKTPKGIKPGDFLRWNVHATNAEWIALKPQVIEQVEKLKARGIRAEHKHKPVHVSTVRLAPEDTGDADAPLLSLDRQLKRYVRQAGTGELDATKVVAEGRSILAEARMAEK
jgi:DNA repair exonuclease SbcCD nuclease subunit